MACPLMMVFMMFGMKGHGHGSNSSNEQALQVQLNELKEQNDRMKEEIQKLSR
ncbi:DUF2933 domain-containing protein [Paenibacillus vini]|uniref:DUF2933 domain-containing protein n=1 Tax=Paenibacillus vini TaxID=1476024 RepID=UPI003F494CB9